MKRKIIIILIISILTCCSLMTYSFFRTDTTGESEDQPIAKFIFQVTRAAEFELPLVDLVPGTEQEILFAVTNTEAGQINEVAMEYELTLKTYHFVPLVIELYEIIDEEPELILTCDETFERNEQNELVCTTPSKTMGFTKEEVVEYKLIISFPSEYNDEIYANLVDYLNLELQAFQQL